MASIVHYEPHEGQKKLHEARRNGTKRIVARIARRWGKTRAGFGDVMATYEKVLQMERPQHLTPPFHAWVVVPSYPQGRQVWHELLSLVPKELFARQPQESQWLIYLKGSSNWQNRAGLIEVKSSHDPESLQSVGLDHLWLSEAQDIPTEAFEKAIATSRSPGRLGIQYFEGIPSLYPDHWFERVYQQAIGGTDPSFKAFHATAFDNPLLSEEHRKEIEADREILSAAAWERLYLARFNINAGFFRNVSACVAGDILLGPVPGREYVAGYDAGWTNDPSVIYIMDRMDRRVVSFHEWDSKIPMQDKHEHIQHMHSEWGFQDFAFDATGPGGKAVEEDFMMRPLPARPVVIDGQTRLDLLNRLAGATERQTISYPLISPLIRQLRAMQYMPIANGKYQLRVPRGEHDDHVFAISLALSSCDDATAPALLVNFASRRYVPTQAEADNGRTGHGSTMVANRRRARLRERAERAGVLNGNP